MDRFSNRRGGSGVTIVAIAVSLDCSSLAFVRVLGASGRVRLGSKRISRVIGGGSGGMRGI